MNTFAKQPTSTKNRNGTRQQTWSARSLQRALEPRMLFDGAIGLTAHEVMADPQREAPTLTVPPAIVDHEAQAKFAVDIEHALPAVAAEASAKPTSAPQTLVVIDPSVPDWSSLVAQLPSDTQVLVLQPGRDPLDQIAQASAGQHELASVQIIAHATPGVLYLGGQAITIDQLQSAQRDLGMIGQALAADGDILIYGCSLAAGNAGAAFVQALAQATQADVAASTNSTGLAGDWNLETTTGPVIRPTWTDSPQVTSWAHNLDETTVQPSAVAPNLHITKGVVGDNVGTGKTFTPTYQDNANSATNPSTQFKAAGTLGSPLIGALTSANVAVANAHLSTGVDSSDTIRYAVVLENQGDGDAFDVALRDELPFGMTPAELSNVQIVRGDGTALAWSDFIDLSSGNPITNQTEFLTALSTTGVVLNNQSGSVGGVEAGLSGTTPVTTGRNILAITYDITLKPNVEAGSQDISLAALISYTDSAGGTVDLTDTAPGNVGGELLDSTSVNISSPMVSKTVLSTDQAHTTGTNVVIGEKIVYEVTMTIPEGNLTNVLFGESLDPGLSLVSIDSVIPSSGNVTYTINSQNTSDVNGGINNRIDIDFGNISNANTDNGTPETIKVTYTVLVVNVAGNQGGASPTQLDSVLDITSDQTSTSITTAAVTVVEPQLTLSLTPDKSSVVPGDTVQYTVTIGNASGVTAFDVDLADLQLPSGYSYVANSLSQTAGPAVTLDGTPFDQTGKLANIASLATGQTITLKFSAKVDPATTATSMTVPVNLVWSSLPGTNNQDLGGTVITGIDTERDGSGGVNDYAANASSTVTCTPSSATQVVLTAINTSEPGTSPNTAATTTPIDVTIGEIVRYRAAIKIAEGGTTNLAVRLNLPSNLQFVNDGKTTVGLVSNNGLTASGVPNKTVTGNIFDWTAQQTGSTPLAAGFVLSNAQIQSSTGSTFAANTVLAVGTSPVLVLGNINNSDSDANDEYVVVEFNAVVANTAPNQGGTAIPLAVDVLSAGSLVAASNTINLNVVEPQISAHKDIVSIVKGVGNSSTLLYRVTFTNTGSVTAYDVRIVDDFSGLTGVQFNSTANGQTGFTEASTGTKLDATFAQINPGETKTIDYHVISSGASVAPYDAVVTYHSENSIGRGLEYTVTNGPNSTSLDSNPTAFTGYLGPRGGDTTAAGGAVNDYRLTLSAELNTVNGTLWFDYNNDRVVDANEERINGQTVTATIAGADGVLGTGDDVVQTTQTNANGMYVFANLPQGPVKISTLASFNGNWGGDSDTASAVWDADSSSALGTINLSLTGGTSHTNQSFAYMRPNDAPTNNVPSAPIAGSEDSPVRITTVSVADVDAGTRPIQVTLSVPKGSLTVPSSGTVTGTGTGATLTLTGSLDDINGLLAQMTYLGALHDVGTVTVTMTTNDLGSTGDGNGDGLGNNPNDALSATSTFDILLAAVPHPPTSADVVRSTPANTPYAFVYADFAFNDIDGDSFASLELVTLPAKGQLLLNGVATHSGQVIPYAQLEQLSYVPPANQIGTPEAQFQFKVTDSTGRAQVGTNTVTINVTDANTAPIFQNLDASKSINHALTIGTILDNNVTVADREIGFARDDWAGAVFTLGRQTGLRPEDVFSSGMIQGGNIMVNGTNIGSASLATPGQLSFTFNGNATSANISQALQSVAYRNTSATLPGSINLNWNLSDGNAGPQGTGGDLHTIASMQIDFFATPHQPPSAVPDQFTIAANKVAATTGNVLGNDSSFDNTTLSVLAFKTPSGSAVAAGTSLQGAYGSLVLQTDGSYSYVLNTTNPSVVALAKNSNLTDHFQYTASDSTGATTSSTLDVIITGINKPPVMTPRDVVVARVGQTNVPVVIPTPTDPDNTVDQLTVIVDALPSGGTLFYNGKAVVVGDRIPAAKIGELLFNANAQTSGAALADGSYAGGTLQLHTTDSQLNSNTIQVDFRLRTSDAPQPVNPDDHRQVPDSHPDVRPTPPWVPPPYDPHPYVNPIPEIFERRNGEIDTSRHGMIPPVIDPQIRVKPGTLVGGEPVRQAVQESAEARYLLDLRFRLRAAAEEDFNTWGKAPPRDTRVTEPTRSAPIVPTQRSAAVECEQENVRHGKPKTYGKPKGLLGESRSADLPKNFSQQLHQYGKKMKPLVKPKTKAVTQC